MPSRAAQVTKISEHAGRDPFEFPPNTASVEYMGVKYTFRELTVQETDEAREGAILDEKFDGRLMTRLMVVASAVEPTMDLEQLAKLPQRLYSRVIDLVNDLNDPEALKDEEELGKS